MFKAFEKAQKRILCSFMHLLLLTPGQPGPALVSEPPPPEPSHLKIGSRGLFKKRLAVRTARLLGPTDFLLLSVVEKKVLGY
jgi:hypothetical protein